MRSAADDLRSQTLARVLDMAPCDRIALALALGDDDLEIFVRTNDLDRDEARQRLRAQRSHGRAPSVANAAAV